ncbi:polysaccharide deacetylase [Heyndrickxia shackletonii]|uniref:Polysaccharide deacetylase n=1 Tax=Heyndrickxia shackletonii TaxID=157838 RepID=A0A0Q3WT28_9BACI|nr:polysaccharide deacetylase [Heyndrickxia shackletonii]
MLILLLSVAFAGCRNNTSDQAEKNKEPMKINTQSPKMKPSNFERTNHFNIKPTNASINTSKWIPVKGTVHIPILMYHSISIGNGLCVPENEFFSQMKWLKENGYYTLSPEEAYLVLTKDIKPRENCVLITFDDGYEDNYTKAYPILKQFGMKATIFMIGRSINKKNHLTAKQMLELSRNGFSVESHTIHHLNLNQLSADQQTSEMKRSKELLDKMLHQNTIFLCYPAGVYNEETLKLAQSAGYKMAVTTEPGDAFRDQGMYSLHRIRIFPGMSLEGFARILATPQ